MINNKVAVTTLKGGAGKSTISVNIVPMSFYFNTDKKYHKEISTEIFLVDNRFEGIKDKEEIVIPIASSESPIKIHEPLNPSNKKSMEYLGEEVDSKAIESSEYNNIIVDIGAGTDARNVIKSLSETIALDDFVIIVPFFLSSDYIGSAIDTIQEIRKQNKNVRILAVANKLGEDVFEDAQHLGMDIKTYVNRFIDREFGAKTLELLSREAKISYIRDYEEELGKLGSKSVLLDMIVENFMKEELTFSYEMNEEKELYKSSLEKNEDKDTAKHTFAENRRKIINKYAYLDMYKDLKVFFEDLKDI